MILVVSLLHRRSHVVVMDGCCWTSVRIVVVRGCYFLPRNAYTLGLLIQQLFSGRGHHPCVASGYLSRQAIFLNFMGWMIGSSCYWALVQSIIIVLAEDTLS
jgi:hypothetical protein